MYDESLVLDNENIIYSVLQKYNLYNRRDEFYDLGMIGLVKAAKNYDVDKGYAFTSYAYRVISNEIFLYMRKHKNDDKKISLNINTSDDENLTLEDLLKSDIDVEKEVIYKDDISRIKYAIESLTEDEKMIIYNLYKIGNNCMNQHELADKLHTSQSYISRKKYKIIKKIREMLGSDE